MDIREATEAEKQDFFEKSARFFSAIRDTLNTLETDIKDDDLMIQASAVWVTSNMATWYSDFVRQIRAIHLQKDEIQKQMESIPKEENIVDCYHSTDENGCYL